MAFLQAYIDDSAGETGDQRLFLGGYINTTANWALFSDAWAEELKTAPPVSSFKMVEANALRGEFGGWSNDTKDEKLRGLVRVIQHFRPLSFQFSVSRQAYFEHTTPNAPRGLNPHFVSTFGVIAMICNYLKSQNIDTQVDFIFDEQSGVSADIGLMWEYMSKNLPNGARRLIAGAPIFRNDKDTLPLQAADMLVWHLRREHEMGSPLSLAEELRAPDGHITTQIEEEHTRTWGREMGQLPYVDKLKSKSQWQKARAEIARLQAAGFIPPHGTRRKNLAYQCRDAILRLIRRH